MLTLCFTCLDILLIYAFCLGLNRHRRQIHQTSHVLSQVCSSQKMPHNMLETMMPGLERQSEMNSEKHLKVDFGELTLKLILHDLNRSR